MIWAEGYFEANLISSLQGLNGPDACFCTDVKDP